LDFNSYLSEQFGVAELLIGTEFEKVDPNILLTGFFLFLQWTELFFEIFYWIALVKWFYDNHV
jgi:hypothetical protein